MTMNITFDTLQYANDLEAAGVSTEQAKAQAKALANVLGESTSNVLATKADINKIDTKLAVLDARMDKLSWMMGVVITTNCAILIKLFF